MKNTLKTFLALILICISVTSLYSQDSQEQTTKRVKEMYDKINQNDLNGAMKYIDANSVDHLPFAPDQKPGLEGFRQVFTLLFKAFPDFNQSINDLIVSSDGKRASILVTMTGTNSGEFMGMPPTNKKISVMGVDIIHFENGMATDHWGFVDNQTMMQQLGASK